VNNTARALALLVSKLPFKGLDVYGPDGSGFSAEELAALNAFRGHEVVRQYDRMPSAPDPVDVVYTTRWQSMGKARPEPDWLSRFAPFAVTKDTMQRFSGSAEAVFMHDLPAVRDQEATSDVLDGVSTTSLVLRQVHHKASAAAAALLWSMGRIA
jgi:ornithine carbamoyltransferase